MDEPTTTPLRPWRFAGTLRTYQQEVLAQLPAGAYERMHIVAPPGSGKTLLGLLLAAREGHRTVVLTPTTTIRRQWAETAGGLTADPAQVSEDELADLTVLTYQRLSVTGDSRPFEDLARALWEEEVAADGRTDAEAATWLARLAVDNPARYQRGIAARARRVRRRFAQQRPEQLARVLHPNAVALIDAIVAHGVRTVVLDECHHLLDHWALVVAYLAARMREAGGCLLIGLTATLPSPDDATEYDNYAGLLGDVDYEVPTPAVVKEGHLAPYSDHVRFTAPTPQEAAFIRRHERLLHELIAQVLSSVDGIRYLEGVLLPPDPAADPAPVDGAYATADRVELLARIDRALSADFALARSCGAVLRELAPEHPLGPLLPPALFGRCATDDLLTVLARFALTVLLPDPAARPQWDYVRRSLADFGYHLTDRGLRRGRDAIETTLATSAAKDLIAADILERELDGPDGDRMRAVVVTDFAVHGNSRGLADAEAAGAVRAFELLATRPRLAPLRPVLVTASLLRVRVADAPVLTDELGALLGERIEAVDEPGPTVALRTPPGDSGRVVSALSAMISRGSVRLLVGTRGLLGEGWDCPAVNTLVDLTTVSTSAATQQLRGRTLRLDPQWPEKVARNWSVACLIPPAVALDDEAEPRRLQRRHAHLWGLSADDHRRVVSGLAQALPSAAREELDAVLSKRPGASLERLDEVSRTVRDREGVRADWRIGEPYAPHEREGVTVRAARRTAVRLAGRRPRIGALGPGATVTMLALVGGGAAAGPLGLNPGGVIAAALCAGAATVLATGVRPVVAALRGRTHPAAVYRGAVLAIGRALQEAGRIGAFDEDAVTVAEEPLPGGGIDFRVEIGGGQTDRRAVADALDELFSPAQSPRFLLVTGRGSLGAGRLAERAAERLAPGRLLLPVPRALGRRRADAESFRDLWEREVGPCALHELTGPEGLLLLRAARSAGDATPGEARSRVWG
ncbi:DEAD/DEAH box helicase family protein [Microbacterium sp.]|uniref:DEAD/DEAH box helicase family protein n=1 Tax=Microbacterium sp. TaxID=51671 RepID=UPI0033407220